MRSVDRPVVVNRIIKVMANIINSIFNVVLFWLFLLYICIPMGFFEMGYTHTNGTGTLTSDSATFNQYQWEQTIYQWVFFV